MADKTPRKVGPPPDFERAFQLVGQFMWHWALLERELNASIHELLGLRGLEAVIATANMGVRDKIHTFKTVVNLYCRTRPAWLEAANIDIEKLAAMSGQRNFVAHTFFGPHRKGGVEFMGYQAKGKFAAPKVVWGVVTFLTHEAEMTRLTDRLKEMVQAVAAEKSLANADLIKALVVRMTNPSSAALAAPRLPESPPPQRQSSPRATRGIAVEKQKSPREK